MSMVSDLVAALANRISDSGQSASQPIDNLSPNAAENGMQTPIAQLLQEILKERGATGTSEQASQNAETGSGSLVGAIEQKFADILNNHSTLSGSFSASFSTPQEVWAGGVALDSAISQLVQAMATFSANSSGVDPGSSSIHTLPSDAPLQNAITAALH